MLCEKLDPNWRCVIILQYDFHLVFTSENIGSERSAHHGSLTLKASLLSGRNLIAYPLPIGGKVWETPQATLRSILINFDSVKYSLWNNFHFVWFRLSACTTARNRHPQIQRSTYFDVSMTFTNHIYDFSENKWPLSSIIFPKFVSRTKILVGQQNTQY